MFMISNYALLEDIEFRNFIRQESLAYNNSVGSRSKLMKTNFVKIIALSQYGQIHEVSLFAAVKREFKEIKYRRKVIENFPIINDLSERHNLNPKTVILAILTSIIYERKSISSIDSI